MSLNHRKRPVDAICDEPIENPSDVLTCSVLSGGLTKGDLAFLRQPRNGLCLLYSILNCLTTVEQRVFLNLEEMDAPINYYDGDCDEFLEFSDLKTNGSWEEDGMKVETVYSWLTCLRWEGLIQGYTLIHHKKRHLFQLLLSKNRNNLNRSFLLTGPCSSDPDRRKSALIHLSGVQKGYRNQLEKAEYRRLTQKEYLKLTKKAQRDYAKEAPPFTRGSTHCSRHAVALVIDQDGTIYLKDPGVKICHVLLKGPAYPDRKIPAGEYLAALELFATKMLRVECIFEFSVQLPVPGPEASYWPVEQEL